MYKIFMAVAVPALIVAWIAYFLWQRHMDKVEREQPRQASPKLQKTRSEVAEWAARMAAFKPPKPPVRSDDDQPGSSDQPTKV